MDDADKRPVKRVLSGFVSDHIWTIGELIDADVAYAAPWKDHRYPV